MDGDYRFIESQCIAGYSGGLSSESSVSVVECIDNVIPDATSKSTGNSQHVETASKDTTVEKPRFLTLNEKTAIAMERVIERRRMLDADH